MTKHERNALIVLLVLLLLGALLWMGRRHSPAPSTATPAPVTVASGTVVAIASAPVASAASVPSPLPGSATKPGKSTASGPHTTATGAPQPPEMKLHTELIPKDISIARCYYEQEIVPPGAQIGFDINGSGFTKEFERMIKVESGHPGVQVRHLKLMTVNQIHGELVVAPEAKTDFAYPRVLIKGLPVFSAPSPFAVIRKGEVLTIFFISMEDSGRAGRFRILTHLDDELFRQFHVLPSTAGLELSDITSHLPYVVEGRLGIGQRVPPGEYGLWIQIGERIVFRRDGMIRIVRPNVGSTGFIQGVRPMTEPYYRPGDTVQIYVQGSGFIEDNVRDLQSHVLGFDMGRGTFTFVNGAQLRLAITIPKNAPVGSYGLSMTNPQGLSLYEQKKVFEVVGADWIAGVQVSPPIKVGGQSTLRILGRDLSEAFVQSLKIETDDPGIAIGPLKRIDATQVAAELMASPQVRPGDYWLHLKSDGRAITPPFGSLIKVESGN